MENKNNFAGIIIPVIISVILLTVLPIINSINSDCPSYNIGNVEVNPDFSSGDYIVDKGSYDYIDSATIIKDENLIPENIKKDVNIFGVVGTYEPTPIENTVILDFTTAGPAFKDYSSFIDLFQYMINSSNIWVDVDTITSNFTSNLVLIGVNSIKFKLKVDSAYTDDCIYAGLSPTELELFSADTTLTESDNYNITENTTFYFYYYSD